jgi:hypothetical protein
MSEVTSFSFPRDIRKVSAASTTHLGQKHRIDKRSAVSSNEDPSASHLRDHRLKRYLAQFHDDLDLKAGRLCSSNQLVLRTQEDARKDEQAGRPSPSPPRSYR